MLPLQRTSHSWAQPPGAGVSLWLHGLSRQRLQSGRLKDLIATRGVVGVTTNPATFRAALQDGCAYRQRIRELAARGADLDAIVRQLTIDDVRDASDLFSAVYSRTRGVDGRVCLPVGPRLADDTDGTIEAALELFKIIERNNILITIPATTAGLPAITAVVANGISVDVTLVFSFERYSAVMDAYLAGLEQARSSGHDLSQIHSVASFFPSRVDTEIDKRLRAIGSADAKTLLGRAALAHARLVYQAYERTFAGERWAALAAAGATKQRPLWASAGTIDLHHDDARYLLSLAAPGTVNAATEKTINSAAADQVIGLNTMGASYSAAAEVFGDLDAVGIDLGEVFEVLETDGVIRCKQAWIEMLGSVDQQLAQVPAHR